MYKIVLFTIIIATIIYFDRLLQITYYTVKSKKIPSPFNGFKILHLSDLHNMSFGKNNYKLINKINNENPDIVVMTGDMVNAYSPNLDIFISLAREISKCYTTYYIVGNHEQSLSNRKYKQLMNELKTIGIKTLDNERIKIIKNNKHINLYGLWFHIKYYKSTQIGYFKNANFEIEENKKLLGEIDYNSYNILLTHNPLYFETYSDWGADLVLAGHIHGGMIRIPFIGGVLSPERKLFPKYNAGSYKINNKELIVNRGLGHSLLGIRIFNRPEISVIELSRTAFTNN